MSDQTTIRVGERPAALGALGTYFDGESAVAHPARIRIEEGQQALVIEFAGRHVLWSLEDVRWLPDQADRSELVLANAHDPVARLITDEMRLAKRCPNLTRRNTHVRRSKVLAWAFGAVASVALIIFVLVPILADQLAEFIPPEGEKALGEATLSQIRTVLDETGIGELPICENQDGLAALDMMRGRLEAHAELPIEMTVHVLDHPMVNAFALPGGHIILFDGLIKAAETPEEVAAVFAHEMGHVESRDPTRHAMRSAGSIGVLGLLLGDFAGGALVLFLTERLIEAQYSQAAEHEADNFAMVTMEAASIAPGALGDMFHRLADQYGESEGVHSHFQTHPTLTERIALSRAWQMDAEARGFAAQPIMSNQEWVQLRAICQ
ncbi:M48 family metallopeptidase [Cognatishimia activa]|uniref:Metalloprotease LoiP n=1 Tax=Cognatishimia activa TaxID=1715691 RepID=A0A0P1IV32_9RHOB|nr:M48 family metallopeptidase [Cognatishimia activa]CUI47875.1 Metalloprotease LoiP precursor [Cognatishimia activa]CUK27425.1 Metalloprotease LoiP precursor [Cognatishimia activa]